MGVGEVWDSFDERQKAASDGGAGTDAAAKPEGDMFSQAGVAAE
jgi:hypothetical protein